MDAVKPGEHLLDEQFGFSVSVRGAKRVGFFNGRTIGRAVERGRRGKSQALHFARQHRFQQSERVNRVVTKIFFRRLHGFAGFDECREVHDRIDTVFLKNAIQHSSVSGVRNDELCSGGNGLLAAMRKIVADDNVAALSEELRSNYAAYVPGSSGDKNAIGHAPLFLCGVRVLACPKSQRITPRIERERQRASEMTCSTAPLAPSKLSNLRNRRTQRAQYGTGLFGAFIFAARPEEAL